MIKEDLSISMSYLLLEPNVLLLIWLFFDKIFNLKPMIFYPPFVHLLGVRDGRLRVPKFGFEVVTPSEVIPESKKYERTQIRQYTETSDFP